MTLDHITYLIASRRSVENTPEILNQIEVMVQDYRSEFIAQRVNRNGILHPSWAQAIKCEEMVKADLMECCGISLPCKLWRTKNKIPRPIQFHTKSGFLYVGPVDEQKGYPNITVQDLRFQHTNRFNKEPKGYFYRDGYIYTVNVRPKKITIRAIFNDPVEAGMYGCKDGECPDFRSEVDYPVGNLARPIRMAILSNEFSIRADNEEGDQAKPDEK